MKFLIKAGNTLPALEATLIKADGAKADLTGATVRFLMRAYGGPVFERVAEVRDAAEGVVWVVFERADTLAGIYQAEFEVLYHDGSFETFPNAGHILIEISNNLRG